MLAQSSSIPVMNRMTALRHRPGPAPLLTLYTLELAEIRGTVHAETLRKIICALAGGVTHVARRGANREVAEPS